MLNYTTVEELKQIPIEDIKDDVYKTSEIVLEYLEYILEHNTGVIMHPEDYAVLQQRLAELQD